LALDIWNTIDIEVLERRVPLAIQVSGEGADELEVGKENLVYRSMAFLFNEAGSKIPALKISSHNNIPMSRGLGSSSAAIATGLVAANELCETEFTANDLLEMATTIEGHPDNVAASLLGGLHLVVAEDQQIFPVSMRAVLFIPECRISTVASREVVPKKVSMSDAVHNMSRTALLVAGFATNHPEYLAVATQDRLHQPYRQLLFPAMKLLFETALKAGALGVFLAGSGSTVLALTQGREMTVAYELAETARQAGVEGKVKITCPVSLGAHVVEAT
jgi:homoserine kinase